MKKLLATLLLGTALTVAALPASAAGTDGTVTMQADGDRVAVSLAVPEGADQSATALRLSFQVEGGDAKASFVFDEGLTSAVQQDRYDEATDILTIYVAGTSTLLDGGSLDLGEIQLTSQKGANATVRVVADSLELVNGAFGKAGVTSAAGNEVSVTVPGTATEPGEEPTQPTPQPSAEPTPTPKPPVESTPTPQPTQKPSEGGSTGGSTSGGSSGGSSSAGGNTSGGSSSNGGSSNSGSGSATPTPAVSTSPVGTAAPVTAAQQPATSGKGSSGSKPSTGKATPAPSTSPEPSATPQASASPAPSATPEAPAASATPEQAQPAQDAPLGLPLIALLVVAGLAAAVLIGVLVVRFRNR